MLFRLYYTYFTWMVEMLYKGVLPHASSQLSARRHHSDSLKQTTGVEFTPQVWTNVTRCFSAWKAMYERLPSIPWPKWIPEASMEELPKFRAQIMLGCTPCPARLSGTAHSGCPKQAHPPKLPQPSIPISFSAAASLTPLSKPETWGSSWIHSTSSS